MTYTISNGEGDSMENPSASVMRRFLDDLDPEDEEHGAAWLVDHLENALEYEVAGTISFERAGEPGVYRHLRDVSIDRVIDLWQKLVSGRFDELEQEPWQPGIRPPMDPEVRAKRDREHAQFQLQRAREFYERLGPERPDTPCRAQDCTRGSVLLSAFCRPHHFENVMRRPCPFND